MKISPIYLSDLPEIVSIYKKIISQEIILLTDELGLPLVLAKSNNEIIGFASAYLNKENELQIKSFFKYGTGDEDIKQLLESQGQKYLSSIPDVNKYKIYIQKLIDWLNKCSWN
jgi:hypothetical protein